MHKYKTHAIVLSIILAIVVPLYTAVKAHRDMSSFPIVKFDIEPVDPRDLMYGHYLTFAIKWNWKGGSGDQQECSYGECCLCVDGAPKNPEVSMKACPPKSEEFPSCNYTLRGNYYGGNTFDAGVTRYYVDEKAALPLEHLFRDKKASFSIGLGMKPHGKPVVEKLYVNDMPLKDFLGLHSGIMEDPNYEFKKGEEPAPKVPTP